MFNQQEQNININISCSLGPEKPHKISLAKQSNKQSKLQTRTDNCDFSTKLTRKNHQSNLGSNNQYKKIVQQKKNKNKKHSNMPKNNVSSCINNDRRIKTEQPMTDNEITSTFKKSSKIKNNHKNLQLHQQKSSQLSKKPQSQAKNSKMFKSTQLSSYKMINCKKKSIQFTDQPTFHISSTSLKKKRTQSAIISNDKLVSKLLNDSILDSELAGSQPMTHESRANDSSQSRRFKEYMSSMDMRMINLMQNDVPVFANKRDLHHDTVRMIMKSKKMSLEELTSKVVTLQRFFKRKIQEKVIYKYKVLFQEVTHKMMRKTKVREISDFSISLEEQQVNLTQNSALPFENETLISSISASNQRNSNKQIEQVFATNNDRMVLNIDKKLQQEAEKGENLNFKKYRELVNKEMNKNMYKNNCREKYKQADHVKVDIKQVSFVLVQNQLINFQFSQNKLSQQQSIGNSLAKSQNKPDFHQDLEFSQIAVSQQDGFKTSQKERKQYDFILPIKENNVIKLNYEDSIDEEQDDNIYDKIKYQDSEDKLIQQLISISSQDLHQLQNHNIKIEKKLTYQSADDINKLKTKQTTNHNNNVVANYLDCGLSDFDLHLNSKIIELPKNITSNLQKQETLKNQQSDEEIGDRFQKANNPIIASKTVDETQFLPNLVTLTKNTIQLDQIVEDIRNDLIAQFSSEISVILNKTAIVPQPKILTQRHAGISANLHSIRDYLNKFLNYLKKQEKLLKKIADTINKDIGPTSLQILSFLRPQTSALSSQSDRQNEEQSLEDQEGLFVVPAQVFQYFQQHLEDQYRVNNRKQLNHRIKSYLNFWHRCIFQCFNECLDFERPYGIQGKPYAWVVLPNIYRRVKYQNILFHLYRAYNRVLEMATVVGGIIFSNPDNSFQEDELSEEQKHMKNQQRLSRILANEIFQNEESWINYNDQTAQLLVQLSRIIEQRMFIQYGGELKKLRRRRKIMSELGEVDQSIIINLQQF